MNTSTIKNTLRSRLAQLAAALAMTACTSLLSGNLQAATTTTTYYLTGQRLENVSFPDGMGNLASQLTKGTLPAGSFLRSITVNMSIDSSDCGDSWLSDFLVYFDSAPDTPGTAAYLQFGGNYGGKVGTVRESAGWTDSDVSPPFSNSKTVTFGTNWLQAVDLHDVQVSVGDNYCGSNFTGTVTLEYDVPLPAIITSFGPYAVIDQNLKTINWTVPYGTNLTTLTPAIVVTTGTCVPASGVSPVLDGNNQATYTVTDGATVNTYTLTVNVAPNETTLLWSGGSGAWDFSTYSWKGQVSGVSTPFFNGVNAIFDTTSGGTVSVAPGMMPLTTVISNTASYTFTGEAIGGGSLTCSGTGTIDLRCSPTHFTSVVVNSGRLFLDPVQNYVFFFPLEFTMNDVTVNAGATLESERTTIHGGTLTMNGGRYWEDNGFGGAWIGPVHLAADSYFGRAESWCYAQKLDGVVSGPGGIVFDSYNNGSSLTLTSNNTYGGATVVNSGTLVCQQSGSLGTGGTLTIASGGAKVQLDYSGTHNLTTLTLGGVAQTAPGTYGSSSSGATYQYDSYFAGTGTVTVVSQSDYDLWLGEFTFAPGADTSPTGDPDGDGMTNQQEYAFGLDPTKGSSANPISQPLSNGVFKYTRRKNSGLTYTYHYSTDLVSPWSSFTPVTSPPAASSVSSTVEEVTIEVPSALLANPKLFLRVQAE